MPDKLTPNQRHYCMSRIRSKDTKPELVVRRELWRRGYRYRLHSKKLPGKPDIVLAKYRTVIFVNGCFWHGHKDCTKYVQPKTNKDFWKNKVSNNRERDLISIQKLEAHDWSIITVWECEVSKARIEETIGRVEKELVLNHLKWITLKDRYKLNHNTSLEEKRKRMAAITAVEKELGEKFRVPQQVKKLSYEVE